MTSTVSFDVKIGHSCDDATLSKPATIPLVDESYFIGELIQTQRWQLDSNLVEIDSFLDCGELDIAFIQFKDGGPAE